MKQLSLIFFALLFSMIARAEGLELKAEDNEKKNFIAVSLENAQFTLPGGAITGIGGKIEYTRYVSPNFSVDPYFAMAFGSTGGVSSTFTGFGGYVNYVLLGDCCSSDHAVKIEGRPLITETKKLGNTLRIAAGFDQVFLNGDKAVYPSSGIGVGTSYDFNLFGLRFRAAGRYSMMTANQQSVKGLFVSGGIVFPF